ncbi:flagellar hook-associated protein FlgK [Acidomonas methanolica]|uniref:Flagellar hook-associated protein 1 n=1 Tax=Acidomonas methanolica NBRC 104435 TaxID=1231351 RepID=A0A023D903_ACIMT|nr:flagellar hook-associated protein FlgK [Acidomonas methanolica]TCS25584.1 flagellar hook-associated protein 1 FlgK [Acidomonas methanolica]GAJ30170.1 flagellar hook-associated protein FlgK [Acidomonas methanolica NBRC 104435]GBQ51859.1 flagellar hook-associated protein FlgK [Acidomonas methanolica]GEK98709.1 flagellar hook protein FlgK [Acidomonas methanolica NBRC 104435]
MLDLSASLAIATSGLRATEYAMGVASQNIANAGTTGYTEEVANVRSLDVEGQGGGVASGPTGLASDMALSNAANTQNAVVASWSVQSNALSAIASLQGSTDASSGSSATLSDELGNIQGALISLTSTPSSTTAQNTVVSDAQTLVTSIQTLASAYQQQRQNAQDAVVSSVNTINTDLTTIGSLSQKIMLLNAQGEDSADLENQRDTIVSQLSSQLSLTTQITSNGDMIVRTASGTVLPTHDTNAVSTDGVSDSWPLSTSSATVDVTKAYPGTSSSNALPGIYLHGRDITANLTGGILGANIVLRDSTLPTMQAQLDSFSYSLATRFQFQGLPLFVSSASGVIPSGNSTETAPDGLVGFAQNISVSGSYTSDPSEIVGGSSADDLTAVQNMLSTGFASGLSAPSSGLGVNGTLSTGYDGSVGLVSLATTLTARQAEVIDTASSNLTTSQSAQTVLQTKLNSATGVSVDNEMSNIVALQNAYAANAKVVAAVQSMFNDLLSAIGA